MRFEKGRLSDTQWVSTRFAFWGFVIGGFGIVAWCHYFGIPFLFSFLVVGAFFMVMLVAMRIICQGGIAYFTLNIAPIDGLLTFFGPRAFSSIGLLVAGVVQKVLFVDLREALMPSLLHANKSTNEVHNRQMIFSGILITLIAAVTTVAVYDNIYRLIDTPVRPGEWVIIFSIVGGVIMLILVICYHRLYWWPLHPIGYLTAYSSAMRILWFSFFIGWMCNALCMRYGGVVLFKRLRYLFVGMIIGDFLMGGGWAIFGLFAGSSYKVLPG
jgi:hypothetical protein